MPQTEPHDFSGYREFTAALRVLAEMPYLDVKWRTAVTSSLDGYAGAELRRLVKLPARRAFGAFFTGSILATRLLRGVRLHPSRHFIYDPTVGAGDLLLAAAKRLPCGPTLSATLTSWGQCLAGTDVQPAFVQATQLRIALLARQRHGDGTSLPDEWVNLLPYIREGDGLDQKTLFSQATHLLMNPPYSLTEAPADCEWAGGRVSEAALFIVRALEQVAAKTRLLAILPDVLRSGSFQRLWRERISDLAACHAVEPYGIFDESADVDVFILDVRRRTSAVTNTKRWPVADAGTGTTVGDYFDVHVGRVVPHRDPEVGPEHPYIHPRCVPTWTVMHEFPESRHHEGLVYRPPFVVIRRTSRPGHPYRATATVISGTQPIAVENHLVVCEPKSKTLKACTDLMRQLKTSAVNDFLNARICCRHLTVDAVRSIPYQQ